MNLDLEKAGNAISKHHGDALRRLSFKVDWGKHVHIRCSWECADGNLCGDEMVITWWSICQSKCDPVFEAARQMIARASSCG